MLRFLILAVFARIDFVYSDGEEQGQCNRCYRLLVNKQNLTWFDARKMCNEKYGGHLAAIKSSSEANFILGALLSKSVVTPESPDVYIGII